jgi:glycerol-1-phosphate dehydrogenase [NAD(P)+]
MLKNINIKVESGIAGRAGELLGGYEKIILVTDEKILKNCQRFFDADFLKKISKKLILKEARADEKNLKKISAAVKNCDLILALGSGSINDLCKLVSAQKNIPYVIFASAASMNGYLSRNASIFISGHKKTVKATLPKMVFCDLGILKAAPLELTKAGIGDVFSFYSCWFDWYLSNQILGTEFNKKPFEMLKGKMDFLVKNFKKFSLQDEAFLKLLIEVLLLSGAGMTIAGGSYPASQSEHLIAHAFEMKYPNFAKKIFHGAQIAITTLTSAKLQKKLLAKKTLQLKSEKFPKRKIENFFGKKVAIECKKEFEQKILTAQETSKINISLKTNWKKIRNELQKIHLNEQQLKQIFSHFKIKTSHQALGLSNQQYQACIAHAKFIRNRFTCLDLI